MLRNHPELIEGGGNIMTPSEPTYTACRLTYEGLGLVPRIIEAFPAKPDFSNWPDRRSRLDRT